MTKNHSANCRATSYRTKLPYAKVKTLLVLTFITLALSLAFVFGTVKTYAVSDKGSAINIVYFVNFNNKDKFADNKYPVLNEMYNTASFGVKSYFNKVSRGQLTLDTVFVKNADGEHEIVLDNNENYYKPKYKYNSATKTYIVTNAEGYDNRWFKSGVAVEENTSGAKQHVDAFLRENQLIREVISKSENYASLSSTIDNDGDGNVDSITFMVNSGAMDSTAWSTLLWPHMTELNNSAVAIKDYYYGVGVDISSITGPLPTVGGKNVLAYDFVSVGEIFRSEYAIGDGYGDVGVLCHELMHTFGAMDFYPYTDSSFEAVGELDIMASTASLPQYPSTYVRQKMGWVKSSDLAELSESGEYKLYPTTSEKNILAYKIDLGYKTGEYFIIEARTNKGGEKTFDSTLKGSGIAVYRVNESAGYIGPDGVKGTIDYANMYGDPQLYAFRVGGGSTVVAVDGLITNSTPYSLALLNPTPQGTKRKDVSTLGAFDNVSGTKITYTDGTNADFKVTATKINADGSVEFKVTFKGDDGLKSGADTVTEPSVFYVGANGNMDMEDNGEVGVSFSAENFKNLVTFTVTSDTLTEEQFRALADDKKITLDLAVPYKIYGAVMTGVKLGKTTKVYYIADRGGVYERFGEFEFDGTVVLGDKNAMQKDSLLEFDGEPKITFKGSECAVNWQTSASGYVIVCIFEGTPEKTTPEYLMAESVEVYYFSAENGSGAITKTGKNLNAYVFAATESGISAVKKINLGGSYNSLLDNFVSCNCGVFDLFGSSALFVTLVAACFVLKRK